MAAPQSRDSEPGSNASVGNNASVWVDGLTIGQTLRRTAELYGDQDAYVFHELNVRSSWEQLDLAADRIAKGLLALGFRPGDHFGIWATNIPEWVILQFATARIGVVLVTINPAYRPSELSYTLKQADIKGIAVIDRFRSDDFLAMMYEVCPQLSDAVDGIVACEQFPILERVIQLRGETSPGMLSWDDLSTAADGVSDDTLRAISQSLVIHDPINIQYTSGTTGRPKGATLSHRNLLMNGYYSGTCQWLTHEDRICLPVPLYHCFGCVLGVLCSVVHGTAMIFPSEGFNPRSSLSAIEAERATSLYGVPTMFIAQLESRDFARRDVSALRTGIMAGSSCPVELMNRVINDMGATDITIGYGQTEASPLITQTRPDDSIELRVGTVGRTHPGFEAKIIDPTTGEELGDNQQGEFCGRGHGIMLGYYNMPDKTAETIDEDGWLHTGDLAERLPNGYFRITGRLTDMIIRAGENIYPREIEERLFQHPAVEDVQIVGIPDRRMGEQVLAWIKLRIEATATEIELRDFCRETLAHFKVPRFWKFVDAFPTTVTGKIQKYRIRSIAIAEMGLKNTTEPTNQ